MKLNANIKIVGEKCELVPYEACHVDQYHKWMEDAEIRRLTGSERLTLEEEYEMQSTWRQDDDKLTFIVLEKSENPEAERMVGDVNLFISNTASDEADIVSGEVEVMIAEPRGRGKGIGEEAVRIIVAWAQKNLQIECFRVKITDDNAPSLQLFQKKLGFQQIGYSNAFKEFTLELPKEKLNSPGFSRYLEDHTQIFSY